MDMNLCEFVLWELNLRIVIFFFVLNEIKFGLIFIGFSGGDI